VRFLPFSRAAFAFCSFSFAAAMRRTASFELWTDSWCSASASCANTTSVSESTATSPSCEDSEPSVPTSINAGRLLPGDDIAASAACEKCFSMPSWLCGAWAAWAWPIFWKKSRTFLASSFFFAATPRIRSSKAFFFSAAPGWAACATCAALALLAAFLNQSPKALAAAASRCALPCASCRRLAS